MVKILVIDDERLVRLTLRKVLEKENHAVLEAENGRIGIDLFEATPGIDLVMTDLIMPEMEGLETIERLRQSVPELRIIAMTGSGRTNNKDYLEIALECGATAAMQKPFTIEEVLDTVGACFK